MTNRKAKILFFVFAIGCGLAIGETLHGVLKFAALLIAIPLYYLGKAQIDKHIKPTDEDTK